MGRTKKIAVLCNYELLPNRVGGMDYFFWMFDQKCKENAIEIEWFFPNSASHGNYKNLTIIDCMYENVALFFANYLNYNQPKYDVVFTHFVEICAPIFKTIKQKTHAKIIAVDHNPRPIEGYPLKKRLVKRIKGLLFSRYIDVFVGVSEYTVLELLTDFGNHLKQKTQTIYNGVKISTIVERKKRNYEKPVFLVASHLRKSKGIQDLMSAVAVLSDDVKSKIIIDIYGDGLFKSELIKIAHDCNVVANFNFLGSKSNLNEIYCNYDYMLQPTHMECFSLSILESLAANVPVITTTVGGNAEVVSDFNNGFLFPAKDVLALSKIIEKLVHGEVKITTNTRLLIEDDFSIENMVSNYYQLIP